MNGYISLVLGLIVLLCGCVNKSPMVAEGYEACPDTRPEICTMIYDPVCGTDGANMSKTYASGCSACSDSGVTAFRKGPCEEPGI